MTMGANDVYSAHEDESAHNDHGMVPIMPMIEVPTKNSDMFDMLPTVNCAWKIRALKRFPIRKQ